MSKNFDDLLLRANEISNKKVAVAVAQDEPVLEAIKLAKEKGIADAILVGDMKAIKKIADKINMDLSDYEIVNEPNVKKASLEAVRLVSTGKADMVMKGLVDTATFLRSVLNKEVGLRTGKLMSHVAVFEVEGLDRLILLTDAAFNTYPDIKGKIQILNNAVDVAHACGIKIPKVAAVCAVEVVNPDMQATIDAALLAKMNDRGQIKDCIVDGPLALDNALSVDAAEHKGITGKVAGKADIILLPAPGTVPGITMEYASKLIKKAHEKGALTMTTIGTSQEGADEDTIRQIALMCKMAGTDIHHIGDSGYMGMALPENITAYSVAIRGKRHTYRRMAMSLLR